MITLTGAAKGAAAFEASEQRKRQEKRQAELDKSKVRRQARQDKLAEEGAVRAAESHEIKKTKHAYAYAKSLAMSGTLSISSQSPEAQTMQKQAGPLQEGQVYGDVQIIEDDDQFTLIPTYVQDGVSHNMDAIFSFQKKKRYADTFTSEGGEKIGYRTTFDEKGKDLGTKEFFRQRHDVRTGGSKGADPKIGKQVKEMEIHSRISKTKATAARAPIAAAQRMLEDETEFLRLLEKDFATGTVEEDEETLRWAQGHRDAIAFNEDLIRTATAEGDSLSKNSEKLLRFAAAVAVEKEKDETLGFAEAGAIVARKIFLEEEMSPEDAANFMQGLPKSILPLLNSAGVEK